jgi:hypothetical protein
VLDGDLLCLLVDFAHFAVAELRGMLGVVIAGRLLREAGRGERGSEDYGGELLHRMISFRRLRR